MFSQAPRTAAMHFRRLMIFALAVVFLAGPARAQDAPAPPGGREGVKLEQPVWITEGGPVVLSDCPLEDDYA